ncbi:flippase-like domain-containing protein [Planctomycetota bacterium]|nr:flippase-like domain-containing protein [Planctomycetota bacterium]
MKQETLKKFLKPIAQILGFVLVILAIYYATHDLTLDIFKSITPTQFFLLIIAVFFNLILTTFLFHIITKSFRTTSPVSYPLMFKLIAFSSLLNYIPLIRPGLWGRAAYLKTSHQLELKDSLLTLGIIFAISIFVFFPTASILLLALANELPSHLINITLLTTFIVLTLIPSFLKPLIRRLLLSRPTQITTPYLWLLLKIIDMLVASFRLYIAFQVLGSPISYHVALLATSASLFVKLLGLTPNGLGLSEWTVAALTAIASPVTAATGAAAALIDRAAEILVTLPLGLISVYQLRNIAPKQQDQKGK